ncbi:MAG: protein translocase subunit SecD [bacterium]|nr:protein translocase subunit SecD [bacterium]
MLENIRAQLFIVLLSILGAAVCISVFEPLFGPDLKGGTQLIYEVPEDVLEELTQKEGDSISVNEIMDQTVLVLKERIDPNGTTGAAVTRSGDTGILIELPWSDDPQDLVRFKDRIANLGKLEMRVVADGDYNAPATDNEPEVRFNMRGESTRLTNWLQQEGNKALMSSKIDELAKNIRRFNEAGPAVGPEAFPNLAWYPRVITASSKNPDAWDRAYSDIPGLSGSVVKVYDDAEWNNGIIPEAARTKAAENGSEPFLVELIAINMHEENFSGDDLDPTGVGPTTDESGGMAVAYQLYGDKSGQYADWSERYIGKSSAIILNGLVKSAPEFITRIPGRGRITGSFTRLEVEELVKVLRTGSLRIEPEFVSQHTVGATLGDEAINKGVISLLIGGVLVFLFMLWYYRKPGVIACITLLLNMTLLFAAMVFMQATITLPGLGGIVLTLGMAVDANVLIYERIREELAKGKDMVRAVRAGFERAMSAILDSNITTFLVGIVLFNVGVGPVRGFAVTLMAGIVMTVFTQFFVTRLLFHFALDRKLLDDYKPRRILGDSHINFVGKIRMCLALSAIVILGGVFFALTAVPRNVMLGIEFTGGGNLQMVVAQSMAADDVRGMIAKDPNFTKDYPNATVNTVGDLDDAGRTNVFNVRLKLNDEQRAKITEGRKAWRELRKENEKQELPPPAPYEPPYLLALKSLFESELVQPASSAPALVEDPDNKALQFAQIELHFQSDINIPDAQQELIKNKLLEGEIQGLADPKATTAKDVLVQWKVPTNTREWELFELARTSLADLKTTDGDKVILSNPFPEAQEIQGSLVDDLRNAAISALIISWGLIIFYLRIRFHEYKYGFAAVVALVHDVLVTFGAVVAANYFGLVSAEISVSMIAAFLTIIGYSVNDTIVVFDRIRENLRENAKAGVEEPMSPVVNRSLNQTLSRTLITTGLTLFVVLAQFFVNWQSESELGAFAFAMIVGMVSGTYSTMFIAAPILIKMRQEEIIIEPEEEEIEDVEALLVEGGNAGGAEAEGEKPAQ